MCTDEFKLKEFNLDSKQCRRTTLAPRFGSPPSALLPLSIANTAEEDPAAAPASPDGAQGRAKACTEHYCFATSSRVIGMGTFPLTGNPNAVGFPQCASDSEPLSAATGAVQVMGIVAHPGEISSLAVSFDGRYAFSAGGSDLSVNMWAVSLDSALSGAQDASAINYGSLSGEEGLVIRGGVDSTTGGNPAARPATDAPMAPFFSLLEGGEGGELHGDIVDYFYYCQLRNLGEDCMEQRNLSGMSAAAVRSSMLPFTAGRPLPRRHPAGGNPVAGARGGLLPLRGGGRQHAQRGSCQSLRGHRRSSLTVLCSLFAGALQVVHRHRGDAGLHSSGNFVVSKWSLRLLAFVTPPRAQDEVIRLYLNHRPVLPLDKQCISVAFEKLCDRCGSTDIGVGLLVLIRLYRTV